MHILRGILFEKKITFHFYFPQLSSICGLNSFSGFKGTLKQKIHRQVFADLRMRAKNWIPGEKSCLVRETMIFSQNFS